MAGVAVVTSFLALPLTLVYFERRLPARTAALVERQIRGGELDGAFELFVLALLAASLGAGLGLLLARRIARPLSAVSDAARRVAEGDLSARPDVSGRTLRGGDEASGLVRDFTAMAQALEQLETERRADAAAIAHELRTPLTILQGRLEAARDGCWRSTTPGWRCCCSRPGCWRAWWRTSRPSASRRRAG
jgi:signal transduction histidine kinase